MLVGSERKLDRLTLRQTSGAPLRVRPSGGVTASAAAAGASRLTLGKPYARHAMWWQTPEVYLYRLVLEGPSSATFVLESEGTP
jgi:hypothetical protein